MRFLFVTGSYKPAVNSGGPVNTVSALAEHLVRFGHSVTIVALNEDDGVAMDVPLRQSALVEAVEVVYFETRQTKLDCLRAKFIQVQRWETGAYTWFDEHLKEYDWVHLHLGLLHPARWLAERCEDFGIPLGYHQRGNLDPRRFSRLKLLKSIYVKVMEVPVLRRCSALFALSEREEEVYRSWCETESVYRLPNGVDAVFWSVETSESKKSPIRGAFSVVWSARWDLRKGPIAFIEMAIRLKKQFPEASFTMMGPERGAALAEIRDYISRHADDVIDLQLGLDKVERREVLSIADYFVLPTQGEGFSAGILEALAAGCSVITTEEANFPELKQKRFGRICPADAGRMAQLIIEDQKELEADRLISRKEALAYVRSHYDWDVIARRYLTIVQETIAKTQPVPKVAT